jgi:hypothetical protein
MNAGKRGGVCGRSKDPSQLQIMVAQARFRMSWSEEERAYRRRYQEPVSARRRLASRARELRPV